MLTELGWGAIHTGQEVDSFLALVEPERVEHDGRYTAYYFHEWAYGYVEVVALDDKLVSGQSMTDMGPGVIYFDVDPRTLRQRALRAELNHAELQIRLELQAGEAE